MHRLVTRHRLSLWGSWLLLLLGGGLHAQTTRDVRFPIVPVRITVRRPILQLPPESLGIQTVAGELAIYDRSEMLEMERQAVLPGVVLKDPPLTIVVGTSLDWIPEANDKIEVKLLLQSEIPCNLVGIDHRMGLFVASAPESVGAQVRNGLVIRLRDMAILGSESRLVCLPGDRAFRFVFVRQPRHQGTAQLVSSDGQFQTVTWFPVFQLDGAFVEMVSTEFNPTWFTLKADNIHKRAEWIRSNQKNIPRGYLGVLFDPIQAAHQGAEATLVQKVVSQSPMEQAGILSGDVLRRLGRLSINEMGDIRRVMLEHLPGDELTVQYRRGKETRSAVVRLGTAVSSPPLAAEPEIAPMPSDIPWKAYSNWELWKKDHLDRPSLGIFFALDDEGGMKSVGVSENRAIRIVFVLPDSPAALAGIQPGDILEKLNDRLVRSAQDVLSCMQQMSSGQTISLVFRRNGRQIQTTAQLPR